MKVAAVFLALSMSFWGLAITNAAPEPMPIPSTPVPSPTPFAATKCEGFDLVTRDWDGRELHRTYSGGGTTGQCARGPLYPAPTARPAAPIVVQGNAPVVQQSSGGGSSGKLQTGPSGNKDASVNWGLIYQPNQPFAMPSGSRIGPPSTGDGGLKVGGVTVKR